MFGSVHTHPRTLSSNSASSTIAECSGEAVLNEQTLSLTTTDLNIMEMTEIEYTQLQQILYSHMESQTSDGDIDTRMNSALFPSGISSSMPQYQSTNITSQTSFTTSSSGLLNVLPVICQSAVSSESSIMSTNQTSGHLDFQELRMMMLNESNIPSNSSNTCEKSTDNVGCDTSGASNVWARQVGAVPGITKENKNLGNLSESRSKSAICVRLEDRFNSIQTEVPRCQEPQEAGVTLNNLVSLICHPSQLVGDQQQNKCDTLVQNKASASKVSLQFKYPGISLMDMDTFGNVGSSQTQTNSVGCGNSCPLLEASKHQEMSLPRSVSFCYQQEIESTKQTLGNQKKLLPEQVWIKVGGTMCKQTINKRSRSSMRQVDASMERKPLRDIQNVRDLQTSGASGVSCSPTKNNTAEQKTDNKQGGSSQRREKHNRMERDRRRRIRICCDELNLLVPFCNVETDKATTLQWTTAFLKYIQERNGDSLKTEFENVFCGKTGRRLKVAKSEGFRTGQAQTSIL
ncbi:transcription factor-like 5 protein [Pseudophryne corroboree]|uniref:transcription factor-like 5 protein n=1 Tax=Pseudophryne corroboree TaxID=495146 RepID=UPI003081A64D